MRYVTLFFQLFFFTLKSEMSYRLNFIVGNLHAPIYVTTMFLILLLTYHNTPVLGGISQQEAIMMFLLFSVVYSLSFIAFIDGFRHFMWQGIRLGELDMILTKPIEPKFLVAFSQPAAKGVFYLIGTFTSFIAYVWLQQLTFGWQNWLFTLMALVLAIILMFQVLMVFSGIAFFFTRVQQLFEFFHKITDMGQYPRPIFPGIIQVMMITVLPMAFFSYFPTLLLFGRITPKIIILEVVVIIGFWLTQRILWHYGLKRYASASS